MNKYLEKLFAKYEISEKDKYDILQIYSLLPENKKQNIINNFENLAFKIKKIEEDIQIEKEILLSSALDKVKMAINKYKKQELKNEIDLQV